MLFPFSRLFSSLCWCIVAILTVSVIILGYKSLPWPLWLDAPIYNYIAWLITKGAVPYRDIFDNNLPGTYLVHLFVIKCFGEGDIAWRIFDLTCLAIIDVFTIAYCRRFGLLAACMAATVFSAFHLYGGSLLPGTRDYIMLVFVIVGIYFFSKYNNKPSNVFYFLLTGFFLGIAFTIKPFIAILCILFFCLQIALYFRTKIRWMQHGVLMLCSFCVPMGILLLWLWAKGGLKAYFDILFHYLIPIYPTIHLSPLHSVLWTYFLGVPFCFLLTAIFVFGLIDIIIQKKLDLHRVVLLFGICYGVIHYVCQQKGLYYHIYPALFFSFLMAASWLEYLRKKSFSTVRIFLICIIVYISCGLTYFSVKNIFKKPVQYFEKTASNEWLIGELSGRVPPGETVQVMEVLGNGILTLLRLHITQPTRFLHDAYFYFKAEHPYVKKLRKIFINELRKSPPIFIVLGKSSWPISGYERIKQFPELNEWLHSNYILHRKSALYLLYKRKSG